MYMRPGCFLKAWLRRSGPYVIIEKEMESNAGQLELEVMIDICKMKSDDSVLDISDDYPYIKLEDTMIEPPANPHHD